MRTTKEQREDCAYYAGCSEPDSEIGRYLKKVVPGLLTDLEEAEANHKSMCATAAHAIVKQGKAEAERDNWGAQCTGWNKRYHLAEAQAQRYREALEYVLECCPEDNFTDRGGMLPVVKDALKEEA